MRTVVVSSEPSAAGADEARIKPAAPASDSVLRKRRRLCVIGIRPPPSAPAARQPASPGGGLGVGGPGTLRGSRHGFNRYGGREAGTLGVALSPRHWRPPADPADRQIRRPRESGDPGASDRNPWVPAFAGMTNMNWIIP